MVTHPSTNPAAHGREPSQTRDLLITSPMP